MALNGGAFHFPLSVLRGREESERGTILSIHSLFHPSHVRDSDCDSSFPPADLPHSTPPPPSSTSPAIAKVEARGPKWFYGKWMKKEKSGKYSGYTHTLHRARLILFLATVNEFLLMRAPSCNCSRLQPRREKTSPVGNSKMERGN